MTKLQDNFQYKREVKKQNTEIATNFLSMKPKEFYTYLKE